MEITNVKQINKGAVVCSFNMVLPNFGITIRDCTLLRGSKGMWVNMPSRMYEKNGEKQYFSYVIWDKEKKNAIDKQVIAFFDNAAKNLNTPVEAFVPDEEIPF